MTILVLLCILGDQINHRFNTAILLSALGTIKWDSRSSLPYVTLFDHNTTLRPVIDIL